MSSDRWRLPHLDFVVVSHPSRIVHATIDDHAELLTLSGSPRYVVWINVGLMNFIKAVANHVIWTLVRPRGSVEAFVDDVARTGGPNLRSLVRELLSRPFDHAAHLHADPLSYTERDAVSPAPPIRMEQFDRSDTEAHRAWVHACRGFTTHVAGHEIGHIYLGHIGPQPRIQLIGGDHGLPTGVVREVEADVVGMTAVWDGVAATTGGSIDFTWLGPVTFLAAMTGVKLVDVDVNDPSLDQATIEPALIYRTRLCFVVRYLMESLVANRFEAERVRRIAIAVPPVAAAIIEWLRINALPDGLPVYQLNGDVDKELREICGWALARI
jgi:hypothetical protein